MKTLNVSTKALLTCSGLSAAILTAHAAPPVLNFEQRDISVVGWSAVYDGCVYDSQSNTATYRYLMTVPNVTGVKDLSHWVLALDSDMVPIASSGSSATAFGLDPTTGVYGFKWDDGQNKGTTELYTLTFNGTCNETQTQYAVKGGTYFAVDDITGPGEGGGEIITYSISGHVYLDADFNSSLDTDEPLFANVTVQLMHNGSPLASMVTGADGAYSFSGLMAGNYSVVVPVATDSSDFNEDLEQYFDAYHNELDASIYDMDVSGVNFGHTTDMASIYDDLDSSDPDSDGYSFTGTGKTIGFWKHQLSVAIKGKGKAQIPASTMTTYLTTLQGMWLYDPFQFSNLFSDAFSILSATSSDEVSLLNKQLLGTELNHMNGGGLSDAMDVQAVLLNWAEFVSHNAYLYSREDVLAVKTLLDTINNSGE